jgi:hypothetical protein
MPLCMSCLHVCTLVLVIHNIVSLLRCALLSCEQHTCTMALVQCAATAACSIPDALSLCLYCTVDAGTGTVTLSLTPPPQQQHNSRSSLSSTRSSLNNSSSSSSSENVSIQLYLRILHNIVYNSSSADAALDGTTVSKTAVATVTSAMTLQPGPGLQGVRLEHKRVPFEDTVTTLSNSTLQQVSV